MYGEKLMDAVIKSISGEIRFYGVNPTNMKLEGIDKHLKFVESYQKLQRAKREFHKR
jgi:ribosomal protein S12 methylthiotransferase accessory factor